MSTINTTMSPTSAQALRPSWRGIVYAELMKITWLRITWVMTVFTISVMALFFLLVLFESSARETLRSNPISYGYSVFITQDMLIFRVLSGFFVMILTVYSMGLEYQQGTIRILLARGVGRIQLVLGKLAALFLIAVIIQVAGIVLALLLLAATVGISTGDMHALGVIVTNDPLGPTFLYQLLNMWVSILLATAVTTLGRSLAVGLTVSLLWFPLDNIASFLMGVLGDLLLPKHILPNLTAYLLGPNLNAVPGVFISQRIPGEFEPAVPVSVSHILITVLVYALVSLVVTLVLAHKRDVHA
jgi:ABC-2 type transport system permease protein